MNVYSLQGIVDMHVAIVRRPGIDERHSEHLL
jgi:hypothetical protein